MPSIALPVSLRGQLLSGTRTFSPASLFSANEPGVWYDPSDLTTLYQDPAGTTPVTAPGNTVGLMLDKSRGLALGAELVANGDFASAAGWTLGAGVSISGGSANWAAATSYGLYRAGVAGVSAGNYYEVTFTVSNYVSGTIRVYLGSVPNLGPNITANGTYTTRLGVTGSGEIGFFAPSGAAFTGSIDNFSVKAIAGNHATQATIAARPTYSIEPVGGRRNLLTWSEDFRDTAAAGETRPWSYSAGASGTQNTHAAPNGTMTADTITTTAGSQVQHAGVAIVSGSAYSAGISIRKTTGATVFPMVAVNSSTVFGQVILNTNTGVANVRSGIPGAANLNVVDQVDYWRLTYRLTPDGSSAALLFYPAASTDGTNYTGGLSGSQVVWGAQLELGSTATAYQRVTTQHDVTEAGVASVGYLYFDGASDNMVTSTITPGIDKVQVFAGVRKLSNTETRVLVGLSTVSTNNGSFELFAPVTTSGEYQFNSNGTVFAFARSAAISVPITNVLTALGDISADRATLRIDGTQVAQATTDQGTGNYLAYPLYLGGRAGTSLLFTGHLYSLITRFGPTLDAPTITSTEIWVGDKTGIDVAKNISTTIYTRSGDTILDRANSTIERRAV